LIVSRRSYLVAGVSDRLMRAAGRAASAGVGESSMRKRLKGLRSVEAAAEAKRLRLPLLTDGEAQALGVTRYVVKGRTTAS
jgi:hypothetical protein